MKVIVPVFVLSLQNMVCILHPYLISLCTSHFSSTQEPHVANACHWTAGV